MKRLIGYAVMATVIGYCSAPLSAQSTGGMVGNPGSPPSSALGSPGGTMPTTTMPAPAPPDESLTMGAMQKSSSSTGGNGPATTGRKKHNAKTTAGMPTPEAYPKN